MTTLLPELLRTVAKTAHPETTRNIKRLNQFLNNLIIKTDLAVAEACWRLGKDPANECLFWAVRNGFAKVVSALLIFSQGETTNESPDVKNLIIQRDKDAALLWAAGLGFTEVVSALLAMALTCMERITQSPEKISEGHSGRIREASDVLI